MRRRRRLVSRETRGGAEARVVVLAWEPAVCARAASVHPARLGPLWRAVRGRGWREDGGRELTLHRRPPIQSALVT